MCLESLLKHLVLSGIEVVCLYNLLVDGDARLGRRLQYLVGCRGAIRGRDGEVETTWSRKAKRTVLLQAYEFRS